MASAWRPLGATVAVIGCQVASAGDVNAGLLQPTSRPTITAATSFAFAELVFNKRNDGVVGGLLVLALGFDLNLGA